MPRDMPDIPITSVDDVRLDRYRDLKQPVGSPRETFIAEGEKLVLRLLDSACHVESILCTEAMREKFSSRLPPDLPVYIASTPVISQLIGFQFHRGVLACGVRPAPRRLDSLWETVSDFESCLLVLCPEIRDPENLGTIIRTAAAFGAAGVIVGESGTDPFSRRVLRTSMGTVLRLPIVQTDDWPTAIATLHAARFETIAAVLGPDAEHLSGFKSANRVALLLGNEDAGLSDEIVALCRRRVTMSMAAGVDSLNVAVAAGILMHHLANAPRIGP